MEQFFPVPASVNNHPNFDELHFFHQDSQQFYVVMQRENENLGLVQGVNVEIFDSLANNASNYLLIFDDSSEENCKSKAVVGFEIAVRHCWMSTFYIKHNLFHQTKLVRKLSSKYAH